VLAVFLHLVELVLQSSTLTVGRVGPLSQAACSLLGAPHATSQLRQLASTTVQRRLHGRGGRRRPRGGPCPAEAASRRRQRRRATPDRAASLRRTRLLLATCLPHLPESRRHCCLQVSTLSLTDPARLSCCRQSLTITRDKLQRSSVVARRYYQLC